MEAIQEKCNDCLQLNFHFSGRPGPDIHGWRCRKTSSLPVAFLPKSFEPQEAPSSTNKPNVSFGPMSFKQTPLRPPHPYPIVFPQLPTCCLSRFHVFMISELPYPTSLSEVQDVSKRSEESLTNISRIFMETTPHCPTQCLSTKRQCETKFEENPVPQRKEHLRLEKRKSPKSFRRGESEVAT